MRITWKPWLVLTAVCSLLLAVWLGCSCEPDQLPPAPLDDGTNGPPDLTDSATDPGPKVPEPVAPVAVVVPTEIPAVQMTDAERALCLVYVGDVMPDGQLPDHEGVEQSLSTLRGSRATVLLFWTAGGSPIGAIKAKAVLDDLQADVAEQYAEQGIQVIAINENDTPETTGQLREDSAATFPMLLDPQGAYFQTVAKESLPRLYVLDADGQILWLDLGYSETTRDTLERVLRCLAAE